ncbi:MAG: hypothetical protein K8J31_19675 [Anaerolineae bacterium]|nr:hypothetical protein [Anaerolineae bacterium]
MWYFLAAIFGIQRTSERQTQLKRFRRRKRWAAFRRRRLRQDSGPVQPR